jgi:hypothetical protein
MPKTLLLALSAALAIGTALATEMGHAGQLAPASLLPANGSDQNILPVQYYGPGSGTGTGGGYGGGAVVRCRTVRIPGSGLGPQRVCDRVPRCRTVRIPGSGLGPQRVCD